MSHLILVGVLNIIDLGYALDFQDAIQTNQPNLLWFKVDANYIISSLAPVMSETGSEKQSKRQRS